MGWIGIQVVRVLANYAFLGLVGVLILCGRTSSYSDYLVTDHSSPIRSSGNFKDALEILSSSPKGKTLIKSALDFWNLKRSTELIQVFHWSTFSKTDAVLTRHFNPETGQEIREREVSIDLREEQSMDDLVLDMAHELVHATHRPTWDPYDPTLTPGRYIQASIEGAGGEVDAILLECQVGFELKLHKGISAERCKKYILLDQQQIRFSRDKIQKDFYRVGEWFRELHSILGEEKKMFSHLSSETPKLYSSTGHAPYPVALYKEYMELTKAACANSKKRQETFQQRAIAQTDNPAQTQISQFLERRCK
jgi:hypothetical protein